MVLSSSALLALGCIELNVGSVIVAMPRCSFGVTFSPGTILLTSI